MNEEEKRPCINFRFCRGYAEPLRSKCSCCIAADEEAQAMKNEKVLNDLELKPRHWRDMWGGRSKR